VTYQTIMTAASLALRKAAVAKALEDTSVPTAQQVAMYQAIIRARLQFSIAREDPKYVARTREQLARGEKLTPWWVEAHVPPRDFDLLEWQEHLRQLQET
jgi:hypothetical protein